jgi:hypothetical protein
VALVWERASGLIDNAIARIPTYEDPAWREWLEVNRDAARPNGNTAREDATKYQNEVRLCLQELANFWAKYDEAISGVDEATFSQAELEIYAKEWAEIFTLSRNAGNDIDRAADSLLGPPLPFRSYSLPAEAVRQLYPNSWLTEYRRSAFGEQLRTRLGIGVYVPMFVLGMFSCIYLVMLVRFSTST